MKRLLLCFALATSSLFSAFAATKSPAPPPGDRYLFVVDTSFSMARLDRASRQAVFDILYTGLEGRMRAGDTFGIWTFNEQVQAGSFPMQVWTPKQSRELTARAVYFLKEQRYEKQSRPDLLVPRLRSVAETVGDVNIFLITDGDVRISGTPFDPDINAAYLIRASARRLAKKPFVTTLAARAGEIVSATVTIAGEPIALPETRATGQLAQVSTAANVLVPLEPAPTNEVKVAAAPVPIVTNRVASIVMRGATRKEPVVVTNKAATLAATNGAPPAAPVAVAAATTNPPPVQPIASASVPLVENKNLAPSTPPPTPAIQPKPVSAPLPATIIVAARELPASNSAAMPPKASVVAASVAVPSPSALRPLGLFIASVALLLAACGLIVWGFRRARTPDQASFISRSFERR